MGYNVKFGYIYIVLELHTRLHFFEVTFLTCAKGILSFSIKHLDLKTFICYMNIMAIVTLHNLISQKELYISRFFPKIYSFQIIRDKHSISRQYLAACFSTITFWLPSEEKGSRGRLSLMVPMQVSILSPCLVEKRKTMLSNSDTRMRAQASGQGVRSTTSE